MLRKSCFFEDLTNSTSSTFSLTLLFFFNPKQAGGSESMYSLGGGRLAPPPRKSP